MPDWGNLVRSRLGDLKLAPWVQDEVFAELSGHLEDVCANFERQGIASEEAARRSWSELKSIRNLARRIERAKQGDENMSNRTKQFWLPALVTSLIGTSLLEFVVHVLGVRPFVLQVPSETSVTIYLPWLLMLPVLGFLGAAWSRREGGTVRTGLAAALFLSLINFAVPWLFVPIAMLVDHETPHMVPFSWFLLNWAVLPCVALLVGALPAAFFGAERKQQVMA